MIAHHFSRHSLRPATNRKGISEMLAEPFLLSFDWTELTRFTPRPESRGNLSE